MSHRKHATGDRSPLFNSHLDKYNYKDAPKSEAEMTPEELFNWNMSYALRLVSKYATYGVPIEDLSQASLMGMHIASNKFDPTLGVPFISYAKLWCERMMQEEVYKIGSPLKIPSFAWRAAFTKGKPVIKSGYAVSQEAIEAAKRATTPHDSIDDFLPGTDIPIGESIKFATIDPDPLDAIDRDALKSVILEFLDLLEPLHAEALTLYFNLNDEKRPHLTLVEIGKRIGKSRERVRQMCEKAMDIIRQNSCNKYKHFWEYAEMYGFHDGSKVDLAFPKYMSHPYKKNYE